MSVGAGPFAALLGFALIIGLLAERVGIPSTVALVVAGAVVSGVHPIPLPFAFGPDVLFVFLPALIFEGAWNIDLPALRRMWRPIVLLAVPGVAITAGFVVAGVSLTGAMAAAPALVLGAIVSATDPVAVIAIFRSLSVPVDVRTIVEGESLANDGVAVALYTTAMALAVSGTVSAWGIAGTLVGGIVGGFLVGAVCAIVISVVAHSTRDSTVEISTTVVLAYGAYALAETLNFSGIFATASAALTLRIFDRRIESLSDHAMVEGFWATIALLANSLVFLMMGLTIQAARIAHEPSLIAVALVSVLLARIVLARGLLPLGGVRNRFGWPTLVGLAGMRGGLSLALALTLPDNVPARPQIIDAVYAIVLVTLVAQGLTIGPYLRRRPPAH